MKCQAKLEVLEGTTYAGKTTVGVVKFLFRVAESKQRAHIMAGNDLGTLEKNVITKDSGLLDVFGSLLSYYPGGGKGVTMPHLRYRVAGGDKIIYVLGYDNKAAGRKPWAASMAVCTSMRPTLRTWISYAKYRSGTTT